MYTRIKTNRGFSLIEMAVVMLIMGTLLSGLLVALTQTSNNTRITTAKTQMLKIEEALYAFAQSNGRLPCPAISSSAGFESPNDGSGDCTQTHGFVPSASLSLYSRLNDDGLMLDPWSNPYRYSVASYKVDTSNPTGPTYGQFVDSTDVNGEYAFTSPTALPALFNDDPTVDITATDDGENAADHMIRICDTQDCTGDIYSLIAPAIVLSMGPNWTNMIDDCETNAGTDEYENAGHVAETSTGGISYCLSGTNIFVDTEYNEESFDDIIIWLSPYILFSRLIDATQLP